MKKIIIVSLYFLIQQTKAQLPVLVDLDLKTNPQLTSMPFDRPVIFKMKSPSDKIYSVGLMEFRHGIKKRFDEELLHSDDKNFKTLVNDWLETMKYHKIPELPERNYFYKYFENKVDEDNDKKKNFYVRIEGLNEFNKEFFIKEPINNNSDKKVNEKKYRNT